MKSKTPIQPPKWPLAFLRFFTRKEYLEEIEGDMEEVFYDMLEKNSRRKAIRIYLFEVLKLFRPNLLRRLHGLNKFSNYLLLTHYFKIGWRSIKKEKVSSLINISGLTIGLTVCLVLFVFVNYESGFDHFHKLADRTYRVVQHTQYPEEELHWNTTAYPLATALREDFQGLELVTQTAGPFERMFSVEGENAETRLFEHDFVLFADEFYPKVFDLEWVSGNRETALSDPQSVVLTERIAMLYFNDVTKAVGKTIMLNSKDALKVTGVVRNARGNSNLRYDMIVSYKFFKLHNDYFANNWGGNYGGTAFVVLPAEVAKTEFESSLVSWKEKYLDEQDNPRINYYLQPLKSVHTESLYGSSPGGYIIPKMLLDSALFVAIFILAIAIVNFVNLVTSRAGTRSREVGIRKAIGGSRTNLIKQFIFENVILVVITLGLSVFSAQIILNLLNDSFSIINLQLELDWSDASLLLGIGFTTILLSTVYPALVLSSYNPMQALKNEVAFGGARFRKFLSGFQFTIVQVFIIASLIVSSQMDHFKNIDLGFTSESVLIAPIPNYDRLEVFKSSLLSDSQFESVSFGSGPPMAVNGLQLGTTFRLPSQSEMEGFHGEMKIGDANYLDFFDLELIAGRNFRENKQRFDEFIVNETVLKVLKWTTEEALGKQLTINEGEATIVGVVKDFHNNSLQNEVSPVILMNWTYFLNKAFVRSAGSNTSQLIKLEETWKETFPKSVYSYEFLNDSIEREYALEQLIFKGFTIFSVLVVLIGSLGLFGLMSFITIRKTKEVGIRKVLGASIPQIVLFFSKEFTALIVVAFVVASPIAYFFMQKWLQDFVYRIDLSIWMFVTGGLLTLVVASIASFFQIAKAVTINPVETLRSE